MGTEDEDGDQAPFVENNNLYEAINLMLSRYFQKFDH
jgi:hypothetical protein